MINNRKQCGWSSSSLTEYHKNHTLYVNYAIQQERFNQGCKSRIILDSDGGAPDSSLLTELMLGCLYNTEEEHKCIISNGCRKEEAIVPVSPLVPSAPTIVSVASGDGTLTVIFTPPSDDGGSPITNYEYSIDNGVTFVSGGTTVSPLTISGLINETTYQVVIRAVNSNGVGVNSNMMTGTPSIYMIINITTTDINRVMSLPFGGLSPSVTVDWGDGSVITYNTTPIQKTYSSSNNFTIRINGSATSFGNNTGSSYTGSRLITSVVQWGSIGFTSLAGAFSSAINLISVPPILPPNITNTAFMFIGASIFNGDISGWDVSKVTIMNSMFAGAFLFNSDITKWDVSKVTTMAGMFNNARAFTRNISIWDVSEVTVMATMFSNTLLFNHDLSLWDVSKVTSMISMFNNAVAFNSPLNWGIKTNKVTNMSYMFSSAAIFNQDISNWDVSNVINMGAMFNNSILFNSPLNWGVKTSKVTNMMSMFRNAIEFNQDISSWDVSSVINMNTMFSAFLPTNPIKFNQDLSPWIATALTTALNIFCGCPMLGQTAKYPPKLIILGQNYGC
jgi:surface protein